jgi:hypothetical protein
MGTVTVEHTRAGARTPIRIASALAALERHGLIESARQVYRQVTVRVVVRESLHRQSGLGRDHSIDKARSSAYGDDSHLVHVACELVRFAHAGATPTELLRIPQYIHQVLTSLGMMTPRPLGVLDLVEARVDGEEDVAFARRVVHGLRPRELRAEAELNRQAAAIYAERADALDLRASRLELGVAS